MAYHEKEILILFTYDELITINLKTDEIHNYTMSDLGLSSDTFKDRVQGIHLIEDGLYMIVVL
jgi:hypothetical protein